MRGKLSAEVSACSSVREENPNCQQTPKPINQMMLGGCSAAGLPLWLMRSHDSLGPETGVTGTEDEKERRKSEKRGAWSSKGMRPVCVGSQGPRLLGLAGPGGEEDRGNGGGRM